MVVGEAVDQQIVDRRAARRRQRRVLRVTDLEPARVVARDPLHRCQRVAARDLDLPHVADIEEAGGGADGAMLLADARVLHRHLPPAERRHAGAERAVAGVERGCFRGGGRRLRHGGGRVLTVLWARRTVKAAVGSVPRDGSVPAPTSLARLRLRPTRHVDLGAW